MAYQPKPLPFSSLRGISQKTLALHHGKLYDGMVKRRNAVAELLHGLLYGGGGKLLYANDMASELKSLKSAERRLSNAIALHELYFEALGGDGIPEVSIVPAIVEKFGTLDRFSRYFTASCLSARGWALLVWDPLDARLRVYTTDSDEEGVWSAKPIIVCDMAEHAYFLDFGTDKASYIRAFFANLNWSSVDRLYQVARK